jgi:hypothetical protein
VKPIGSSRMKPGRRACILRQPANLMVADRFDSRDLVCWTGPRLIGGSR